MDVVKNYGRKLCSPQPPPLPSPPLRGSWSMGYQFAHGRPTKHANPTVLLSPDQIERPLPPPLSLSLSVAGRGWGVEEGNLRPVGFSTVSICYFRSSSSLPLPSFRGPVLARLARSPRLNGPDNGSLYRYFTATFFLTVYNFIFAGKTGPVVFSRRSGNEDGIEDERERERERGEGGRRKVEKSGIEG